MGITHLQKKSRMWGVPALCSASIILSVFITQFQAFLLLFHFPNTAPLDNVSFNLISNCSGICLFTFLGLQPNLSTSILLQPKAAGREVRWYFCSYLLLLHWNIYSSLHRLSSAGRIHVSPPFLVSFNWGSLSVCRHFTVCVHRGEKSRKVM